VHYKVSRVDFTHKKRDCKMALLRDRQRESRRQRTLDAAEGLIRDTGTTDFSMLALAERAELSPATPYNLFGSKAGIMYALLNRSMDLVDRGGSRAGIHSDPFDRVVQAGRAAVEVFAADSAFYRPLHRLLLGASDSQHRPAFMDRGLQYWKVVVKGLDEAGALCAEIDADELARQLEINFLGALDLWVQEELDDDEFRAQIVYGTALLLLAIADDKARARLLLRLRTAKKKLPRRFSFKAAVERARGRQRNDAA
jgi:AcrR family transcriptional regulator